MSYSLSKKTTELLCQYIDSGDKKSLCLFFKEISDVLYRIALRFMRNKDDAEDMLQNSFLTIMKKAKDIERKNLSSDKAVLSWCMTIIVNLCRMRLRENKRRTQREIAAGSQRWESRKSMSSDEVIEKSEKLSGFLESALELLPTKYSMPIYLRYIKKMEIDEISTALTEKPGTIRVQLKRGLDKLSVLLKSKGIATTSAFLVSLLGGIDLEAAPVSTPSMIEDVVYGKVKLSGRRSRRIAYSKPRSAFSLPLLIAVCLVGSASIVYLFSTLHLGEDIANEMNGDRAWDFTKKMPAGVVAYNNGLSYVNSEQAHRSAGNGISVLSFDFKKQTRILCIESELVCKKSNNGKNLNLIHRFTWSSGSAVRGFSVYQLSYFELNDKDRLTVKTYIFEDLLINVIKGDVVEVIKVNEVSDKSELMLWSKNFLIKKVKVKVIDTMPAQIEDVIGKMEALDPTSITGEVDLKKQRIISEN